ncbi:hypothetical protein OEA41_008210 [Lepraria neglecta]|uniref:SGNH hydrolase-type esterase domain-containing protein n=1 Tax=Lepraria neglecta TaxID=209136 RepID=A0AAD9ZH09_9LECA|nr:hypothetical protein OEA41_008210 [Lepraria neglecta]
MLIHSQGPYDQFLLFGDSITQQSCDQASGFAFSPALQNAFIRRLDVINRGFSGYNTAQALVALPAFMPKPEQASLRFMAVFFGANDACLPGTTGQDVPLNEFKQNLRDIIQHKTVTAQKPRIILITTPPINEYKLEEHYLAKGVSDRSRTAEHTKKYADACKDIGKELDVAVLDIWSIMMAKAGWKEGELLVGSKKVERSKVLDELLVDGLHFLPVAYRVLYESMMELICRTWPDQYPENVPFVFPAWTKTPV